MYCNPLDRSSNRTDYTYQLTCSNADQMEDEDRRIFEEITAFRLCLAAAVQDVADLNKMTETQTVIEGEFVLFWIYAARVVAHLADLGRDGEGAVLNHYSIVIDGFGNAIDSCSVAETIEALI